MFVGKLITTVFIAVSNLAKSWETKEANWAQENPDRRKFWENENKVDEQLSKQFSRAVAI